MLFRRLITPFAVAACVMSLAACASRGDNSQDRGLLGGVFGGGGQVSDAPEAGIGVNSFLWRASLDTLSFMPLNSADPFGGVIITDWYTPPETPSERSENPGPPSGYGTILCHNSGSPCGQPRT